MKTFDLANPILIVNPHANNDFLYGPYTSITNVLEALPYDIREKGRTVGVDTLSGIIEYWFKEGVEDTDLVIKNSALDIDKVLTIGPITADSNKVYLALSNEGKNEVVINGNNYSTTVPQEFPFTPVTTGIKVLIIYAKDDSQIFYLAEGIEAPEAVEPVYVGLFVARLIVSTTGIIIQEEDSTYKNKSDDTIALIILNNDTATWVFGDRTNYDITATGLVTAPILAGFKYADSSPAIWNGKKSIIRNRTGSPLLLKKVTPPTDALVYFPFKQDYTIADGKDAQVIYDNNNEVALVDTGGGGGGTTGESFISVTKTELDTHIANSTLKPGFLYGITETERWMLLGDSTDTLYLRAISANQLETKGTGKFFIPKYDQDVDGYGIWQGEVYEAFPTTVPEPNYAVDDEVIWGGRLWKNLTGLLGFKQDIYTLSEDWEVIPFNETDYNVRFDKIEYDYQNDMVIYRKDDNGTEISTSYQDWTGKEYNFVGDLLNISLWNSLKIYQWGNEFNYDSNKGIGFNIVTNSILECLNTCGQIYSNTLNNGLIRLGLANTINNKTIQYLTITNGDIGGDTGIDLSSATLVYADYTREVFKNSVGVTKIRYVDGTGTTVIADLTD